MDLVSVIIPVYNSEKYIGKCIESILNQSYSSIEIVLVDDGSTDNSKTVISHFEDGKKIRYIYQKNNGAAAARNTGINNANGKYIVFVDADDICEKEHIENLVRAHKADNTLVICGYNRVFGNKKVKISPGNKTYSMENISELVNAWTMDPIVGSPCNKLIETSILNGYSIRYPEDTLYAEDFIFSIRLMKCCERIVSISDCTYNYNMTTPGSLTKVNTKNPEKLFLDQKKVYEEMIDFLPDDISNKLMAYMIVLNCYERININSDIIEEFKELYSEQLSIIRKIKTIRSKNINLGLDIYYRTFRTLCLSKSSITKNICKYLLILATGL